MILLDTSVCIIKETNLFKNNWSNSDCRAVHW